MIPGLEKTNASSSMTRLKESETTEQAIGRAARLPPVANVDFREKDPKTNNAILQTYGVQYWHTHNPSEGGTWRLARDGFFLEFATEVSPLKDQKYYIDLHSHFEDPYNKAAVILEVNGHVISFDPSVEKNSIDITNHLQDGENIVKITLQGRDKRYSDFEFQGFNFEIQSVSIQAR